MKDKYEKVILGVAAVIAIAMVALGVMKMGAAENDFGAAEISPEGPKPIQSDFEITRNAELLSKPLVFEAIETDKGRKVDTLTGPNIYVRRNADKSLTVDPDAPGEKPVHGKIPNGWWAEHGLSDVMGYGDAPQQDSDGDGFSNLEEFNENTLPNDKNSFPSLFAKVRVASIDKTQWYLRFSDFGGGSLSFRIEGTARKDGKMVRVANRMKGGLAIPPGKTFFAEEPYKGRFKFVEATEKVVRSIPKKFAEIEDLKPGKGNKTYSIPSGSHKTYYSDYSARLYLDTPSQKSTKFEVEEGMSFSLPYDESAAEKPYTLEKIGEEGKTAHLLWKNNGETKKLELRLEN